MIRHQDGKNLTNGGDVPLEADEGTLHVQSGL